VAFGDSLSEGFGVDPGQSFPDLLQKVLDEKGYRYRIVNQGISGDTTTGGLGRVGAVTALKPALVLLELGGNDGLRGVPVTSTKQNLDRLITTLKASGTTVVLAGMTLPPNYGPDYIRMFEDVYRDLARKHHVTLIPFLMQDIVDQFAKRPGLMQRDGIHPSPEGHQLIAKSVFRYIEPLLSK
jgi:acyl-CoA thioesterase-1